MAVESTQVYEERPVKSDLGSTNVRNGNAVWLVLAFNEQQPSVLGPKVMEQTASHSQEPMWGNQMMVTGQTLARAPFVFPLRSQK